MGRSQNSVPMGDPGAGSSGTTQRRRTFEEAQQHRAVDSPLSSSCPLLYKHSRSVRRRVDFDHLPTQPSSIQQISTPVPRLPQACMELATIPTNPSTIHMPHTFEFVVYLPNRASVEIQVPKEVCTSLTVQGFVKLVKMELARSSVTKVMERGVIWGDHVQVCDFQGNPVRDGDFASSHEVKSAKTLLLYDLHPDTVHAHPGFWNVTPEPHMLEVLPQDYTLFSALADELDNSLQAVYQLKPGKERLICVNLDHNNGKICMYDTGKGMDGTPDNCIAKWGTLGSSNNRHVVPEAIGGEPPYLKPNFGMYGFGGISAGFHLGGCITVSSKTEPSQRVAILHLGQKSLTENVKSGSVWKTGGEFRAPTEQELQWSPHGSFTKVEISELNRKVSTWRVEEVQRKLKDYYFPYIQNDEGRSQTFTTTPVEIRVNGENLAGVVGGEVAHSYLKSGPGDPFEVILEFTKAKDMDLSEHVGDRIDKANARITCHYFPISQGREAIDDIIELLKEEDSDFMENFESFSRRSIRRLGRLLPDARGGRLPFMEPKKVFRVNEVNRHCYKRVKAFIDVDAGFIPTQSKMDLVPKDPFTEALLNLGLGLQTVDTAKITLKKPGPVSVSIKRWSVEHQGWGSIKPQELHAEYTIWIAKQHESFDVGAIFNEGSLVLVTQPRNRKELNITKDVFRVVYDIKCKDIDWKVGKGEPAKRLRLLKGLPGLNNNDKSLLVTVECFISEGFPDDPGETRIICRPIEIPEERGSREGMDEEDNQPNFSLGESRAFPVEIIFADKHEEVSETAWLKRLDVIQNKLPAFVELLNEGELVELGVHRSLLQCTNIQAGTALPPDIIAVVRPSSSKILTSGRPVELSRLEQKYIMAEAMEMTLVVREMKDKGASEADRIYQAKTTACTRGNWKGLYYFPTTGSILETVIRATGTYEFTFTLVSSKYQEVKDFKMYINITPSSTIGHWNICSHSGLCMLNHPNKSPQVMKVRLGDVLPGTLYLTRGDEFGNAMEFTEIPADITARIYSIEGDALMNVVTIDKELFQISDEDQLSFEIPRIAVGGGVLRPLKPTLQASLRFSIEGCVVTNFSISVLPGGIASARMKEGEAPENRLKPGQTIDRIVFEALDEYENPVSSGEQVKVVLEGFELQDKKGYTRSMDENGSLDLGMRLKVIAGYGETARVELRSTKDEFLLATTFDIIERKIQLKNVPDHTTMGSVLTGIVIEVLDEDEKRDETMDGTAHTLTLDWNPNISVPLKQGRCTLPPIPMPNTPQLWKGCVAHTQNPELQALLSVYVEDAERGGDSSPSSTNPSDIQRTPFAPPRSPKPRVYTTRKAASVAPQAPQFHHFAHEPHAIRKSATAARQAPHDVAPEPFVQPEPLATRNVDFIKVLENKLSNLEKKFNKIENEEKRLKLVKKEHEDALKRYAVELKMVKSELLSSGAVPEPVFDPAAGGGLSGFALTPMQVEFKVSELGSPPGTHAASILLRAQAEGHNAIMQGDGIIGIVALLGAINGEQLNRALVEFLGVENMLTIICGSRSAAESLGIPPTAGTVHKSQGLSDFARTKNLRISGRFRVLTLLEDSSFYKREDGSPPVNNSHPQRLLNMGPVSKPGSERLVGSLGYAVNMIHLNDEQLSIRVAGHGLRESLFFMLFGYLEVFDTRNNMIRARNNIRTTAVSLDGGLIRARNQFELGSREDPVLWFPAVQLNDTPSNQKFRTQPDQLTKNMAAKRTELEGRAITAKQRYEQGGTENDIKKVEEKLQRILRKIEGVKQDIKAASHTATTPPVSKPRNCKF